MATFLGRISIGLFIAAGLSGCSKLERPLPPAQYVPPDSGTVFHYDSFSNEIIANDGWHTLYRDQQGRFGSRLALFIMERPDLPAQLVDTTALSRLWPLDRRASVRLEVQRGAELYEMEFRVNKEHATIEVPAGRFKTFVVQAVESPRRVHDPANAPVTSHIWWYAPKVNAVVRYKTTYLSGPARAQGFTGELVRIERPESADE